MPGTARYRSQTTPVPAGKEVDGQTTTRGHELHRAPDSLDSASVQLHAVTGKRRRLTLGEIDADQGHSSFHPEHTQLGPTASTPLKRVVGTEGIYITA